MDLRWARRNIRRATRPERPSLRCAAGRAALSACLILAVAAGACGSSGRELRTPPGFTESQVRFVPVNQSQGPDGMLIEGAEFEPGGDLPRAAVEADGPPTLIWWNIPAGTSELVVLVTAFDPEDPPILWAVAGLGPSSAGLFGEPLPPGVRPLLRADGSGDWPGYPAPGTRMVFSLCALAAPLPPHAVASDAANLCTEALGVATVSGLVAVPAP
ncbi:MAG: hypothetical protein OXG47_04765 [bacterium]|nr:hypothetical protein [bacterium]